MKTETFPDGSTIETDETTGNRTVCGKQAHDEYFKRLRDERIFATTPYAVMSFCRDMDGTRKAELIRRTVDNPMSQEFLGQYSWEVWTSDAPDSVTRFMDHTKAKRAFDAACLHGTNGFGKAQTTP